VKEVSDQEYVKGVIKEMTGGKEEAQEAAYISAIHDIIKTSVAEEPVVESKDSVPIEMDGKLSKDVSIIEVKSSESEGAGQSPKEPSNLKKTKFKPSPKVVKGVEPDDAGESKTVVSEEIPVSPMKAVEVGTSVSPEKKKVTPSWDYFGKMSEPVLIRRNRRMSYKEGALVSTEEKDPLDDFDKSQAERIRRATTTITRPEAKVEAKVETKKEEPKISELVRPSARKIAMVPVEIKDEVVDVMRFSVPNIVSDDFGEEDLSDVPDDGIEALLYQSMVCAEAVPADGSPVVFSFGGGDPASDGVRFIFGPY
jgi:hypothetical protein